MKKIFKIFTTLFAFFAICIGLASCDLNPTSSKKDC